ncbi:MAG: HEAT repeat domain-containing protein [Pleurocapsa sp.]
MNLDQIKINLDSSDPQQRMKAITGLRNYEADIVVPLLKNHIKDKEFLVRSFVAMGFGKKQNAESFAALLEMIKFDSDPNVRAEAANSLSYYGDVAASHLTLMFERDDHWLVRRSIVAALADLNCPQELFEVCLLGIDGEDQSVRESCIICLSRFANTDKEEVALDKLLSLAESTQWRDRLQAAKILAKFEHPQAVAVLNKLKQDSDHRVVAAVLESLV